MVMERAVRKGTLVVATQDAALVAAARRLSGDLELVVETDGSGRGLAERTAKRAGSIQIMILDEELLDGSGRAALPEIRRACGELKVIFTAREASRSLEVEVRREGVYYFLPKPIDEGLLQRVLGKALEHESTRYSWRWVGPPGVEPTAKTQRRKGEMGGAW